MIEMYYRSEPLLIPLTLTKAQIGNYKYIVLSRGIYPECYIQLPLRHRLSWKTEEFINENIKVHGELAYKGLNNHGEIPYLDKGHRVLGWSYSQMGDYVGYYKKCGFSTDIEMKQWSTEEIVKQVKNAIEQMKGFY